MKDKKEIVDRMTSVGGYIMLSDGLRDKAVSLANNTAAIITNRVRSNQTSRSVDNDKPLHVGSTPSPAIVAQESFQPRKSISAKTDSPVIANALDSQKKLNTEPNYQMVVARIREKASKFTALGLDVRNERDLNVAIAITSKVGGWDTKKVLEQSSQYQDLSPETKEAWLAGITGKANELLQPRAANSNRQNQTIKPEYER